MHKYLGFTIDLIIKRVKFCFKIFIYEIKFNHFLSKLYSKKFKIILHSVFFMLSLNIKKFTLFITKIVFLQALNLFYLIIKHSIRKKIK